MSKEPTAAEVWEAGLLKARMKRHEPPEERELRMGRRVKKVLTDK